MFSAKFSIVVGPLEAKKVNGPRSAWHFVTCGCTLTKARVEPCRIIPCGLCIMVLNADLSMTTMIDFIVCIPSDFFSGDLSPPTNVIHANSQQTTADVAKYMYSKINQRVAYIESNVWLKRRMFLYKLASSTSANFPFFGHHLKFEVRKISKHDE